MSVGEQTIRKVDMDKQEHVVTVKLGPGDRQALVAVLQAVRQAANDGEVVLRIVNESGDNSKKKPEACWEAPPNFRPHFWWLRLIRFDSFVPFIMLTSVLGFICFHLTGIAPAWAGFGVGYAAALLLSSVGIAFHGR